jgi:hypothetical protein
MDTKKRSILSPIKISKHNSQIKKQQNYSNVNHNNIDESDTRLKGNIELSATSHVLNKSKSILSTNVCMNLDVVSEDFPVHSDFQRYCVLLQDDKWNTRNTAGNALRRLLQLSISANGTNSKCSNKAKFSTNSNRKKNNTMAYTNKEILSLLKNLGNIIPAIVLKEKHTIVIKSICLLIETFVSIKSIRDELATRSTFEILLPHLLHLSVATQVGFSIPSKSLLEKIAKNIKISPNILLNMYSRARNEPLIRMAIIKLFIIKVNSWPLLGNNNGEDSEQQEKQQAIPAEDLGALMVLIPRALADNFEQIPPLCTKLFLNIFQKHKYEATLIFEILKAKAQVYLLRENEKLQIAYAWPKRMSSTPLKYHANGTNSEKRRAALNKWINAREKEQEQQQKQSGSKFSNIVQNTNNNSCIKTKSLNNGDPSCKTFDNTMLSAGPSSIIKSRKKALARINKKKKKKSSKRQLLFDHEMETNMENKNDENNSFQSNSSSAGYDRLVEKKREIVTNTQSMQSDMIPRIENSRTVTHAQSMFPGMLPQIDLSQITSHDVDLSLFSSIQEECVKVFETQQIITVDDTIANSSDVRNRGDTINTPKLTERELDQILNENNVVDTFEVEEENIHPAAEVIKFSTSSNSNNCFNVIGNAQESPVDMLGTILYNVVVSPPSAIPSNENLLKIDSPKDDGALQKQLEQMQKDLEEINNIQNEAEEEMSNAVNEVKSARKNKVISSPAPATKVDSKHDVGTKVVIISPSRNNLDTINMQRDLLLLKKKCSSSSSSSLTKYDDKEEDLNELFNSIDGTSNIDTMTLIVAEKEEPNKFTKTIDITPNIDTPTLVVAEKEEPNEFIKKIDETSNIDKSETIDEKIIDHYETRKNNTVNKFQVEKELDIFFAMMKSVDSTISADENFNSNEAFVDTNSTFSIIKTKSIQQTESKNFNIYHMIKFISVISLSMTCYFLTLMENIDDIHTGLIIKKLLPAPLKTDSFNTPTLYNPSCFPVITTEEDEISGRKLCYDPIANIFQDISFNKKDENNVKLKENKAVLVADTKVEMIEPIRTLNLYKLGHEQPFFNDAISSDTPIAFYNAKTFHLVDDHHFVDLSKYEKIVEILTPSKVIQPTQTFKIHKIAHQQKAPFIGLSNDDEYLSTVFNSVETTHLLDDEAFLDLKNFNVANSNLGKAIEVDSKSVNSGLTPPDSDNLSMYVSLVFIISTGLFIALNYNKIDIFEHEKADFEVKESSTHDSSSDNGFNAVHVSLNNDGKVTTLTPVRRSVRVQRKVARSMKKVQSFDINLTSEDVKRFLVK